MLKFAGSVAWVLLLVAACGGSDPVADRSPAMAVPAVEPTAVAAEATPVPTEEPTAVPVTPTPVPVLDDQVLVDAAWRVYAESEQAGAWFAWEPVRSRHRGDGLVDLDVCVWDGLSVGNLVRTARVQVEGDTADSLSGTVLGESAGPGECVTDAMLESALEHAELYDRAWAEVSQQPDLAEERLQALTTIESFAAASEELERRRLDGVTWVAAALPDVAYPDDLVEVALYRFVGAELQLVLCSTMNPEFGLYRDGVLVDDFVPEDNGPHRVSHYRLVSAEVAGGWKTIVVDGLSWADCLRVDDWPAEASAWQPDGPPFSEWPAATP